MDDIIVEFNPAAFKHGITEAEMTDEEADYWDEYFTKNPPKVSGDGKSGFFARHKASRMVALDDLSTNYLTTKAIAVHKTPAELISELVRKEIVSSLNEEPVAGK